MHYTCKYCGKQFNCNKGCITRHEKSCEYNPDAILSKTKQLQLKRQYNKQHNIKFKMSDEQRYKISEGRKKYLAEHRNEHVWKRSKKFKSNPCEYLKQLLRNNNIPFEEEYTPLKERHFSLDICWPNKMLAIEVNGNQHYNNDGTLTDYYKERHDILTNAGWKIIEIHYSKCYSLTIDDILNIFNSEFEYDDTKFANEYFKFKQQEELKKLEQNILVSERKRKIQQNKKDKELHYKLCIQQICDSGIIDFTRFGWVDKMQKELIKHNIVLAGNISKFIARYYPEFFEVYNPFIRKRFRDS